LGIYPNTGLSMPTPEGKIENVIEIEEFTKKMMDVMNAGASILGSCCGSTPEYTNSLRKLIDGLEE
jgi:methionine synthase I (cobalamin-dependent)|tara:strand:- start:41686 stop:41883 length:198 start_codon:yes stop_codon:yes gene_type:complete